MSKKKPKLKEISIEDNIDWLELGNDIPEELDHPLFKHDSIYKKMEPCDEFILWCVELDNISFVCKSILNVEILPFQAVILKTLFTKRLPLLIGSRGCGKTFILSVYALLRMMLTPGCKVVVVGSALRQSKQLHDYMVAIWDEAPILRDIAGKGKNFGPKRQVDRYEFRVGKSTTACLPMGTGEKIRGMRANYIISDEFASLSEEIFNVVVQGFGIVALSPKDKVKQAALVRRLKEEKLWTDELQKLHDDNKEGNQIVYSGTAYYGFNHFCKHYKIWRKIISSRGDNKKLLEVFPDGVPDGLHWKDYAILRIPYTHVPEGLLDPGILAQARATLTRSQFLMEYCAIFAEDSDGFFLRSIIEAATTNKPIITASGKEVQFSASKRGDPDRVFVIGIDPAADRDNAAIVVVEMRQDHRRVVHCWSTNTSKYKEWLKYQGGDKAKDRGYYKYISHKIRELINLFNVEHIIMDKHGGGLAIAEALADESTLTKGEHRVFEVIDSDEPKQQDLEEGLHILELAKPTNDLNSEANHGMLKDLQDKTLLFPMFDALEMAKALRYDDINKIKFDTYEDLVSEIEELKDEMTTIVVTPSSILGREVFNTPEVKTEQHKKGRLRKDRYSALLYANYYIRNKENSEFNVEYKAVGGTAATRTKKTVTKSTGMYTGLGVVGMKNNNWAKRGKVGFIKHNNKW